MKNGILAVNKPEGISSARVVAQVKKILNAKKVGHTGTLDPFATGLLLCAVNQGTRISRFFLGSDKDYRAKIHLGSVTDTYDRTGEIIRRVSQEDVARLSPDRITAVLASFKGRQLQVPPCYSALKHKGTPLYKLARQGKQVEKPPRPIEIYHIHLCEIALPYLDIQLSCSSGTYVRSIAYDLGEKLGCGAHLAELCRTRSGLFNLDQAVELDELETLAPDAAAQNIHPMSECLSFLPEIVADTRNAVKIQHGQTLYTADLGPDMKRGQATDTNADKIDKDFYRVSDSAGRLLAVVTRSEDGRTYNYSCVFSE